MSEQDLQAELERLKAENEALKAKTTRATSIRVSEKGGVSVYGLGHPVTLQGAVVETARDGGGNPPVHRGERREAQNQGMISPVPVTALPRAGSSPAPA